MSQVLTFHNNELKKQEYVELYKKQRKAGKLIRGEYFCQDTGNACLVGTIVHGKDHQLMAQQTGLPDWLIYLSEFLFENLPQDKYKTFPEKLFKAIPVGATQEQLQVVWHKLAIFLLEEIAQFDRTNYPQVRAAVETVIALHTQEIEKPNSTQDAARTAAWTAAETAAWTAARTAAWTAVRTAAETAAWTAARTAARTAAWTAAWTAAETAAWTAVRTAARTAAVSKIADKLIELLLEIQP